MDNTTVTIDAILTKKGRELLAKGRSQFNITKFALADDEVDYDISGDVDIDDEWVEKVEVSKEVETQHSLYF